MVSFADMRLRGAAGFLHARLHRPRAGTALLVYFPASGYMSGGIDQAGLLCRQLSAMADLLVLAVAYRTVPEHPHPAGFHDAVAVLEWVIDHAAELGADPARILVGGEGAGGNLAAAVALHTRNQRWPLLAGQLLIHPSLDALQGSPSLRERPVTPLLSTATLRAFYDTQLCTGASPDDPYLSPLHAPSLAGLAPATVITVEHDPLRDDGRRYAARLRQDGVPTEEHHYDDLFHGVLSELGHHDGADRLLADLASFVRRC
ncbi:alpha/beta hydrolase [Streptosporangium sp. CA-135522]|uniref:alpha/beta hydrolase n=1 Tax=Streptosporangium sp. CA-135522 TaxID=3240072 RepID=UPI003D911E72